MRAFKRFGIAQLICSCAFVPQASAVQVQLSDYALVSWREIGSLDAPVIYAITQDHDGYLWLGTNGGLIRFDGVTFVRWDVGRGSQRVPIGRDFRFACPGWLRYTSESRRAHEIVFVAPSSSSRGRHLSPRCHDVRPTGAPAFRAFLRHRSTLVLFLLHAGLHCTRRASACRHG